MSLALARPGDEKEMHRTPATNSDLDRSADSALLQVYDLLDLEPTSASGSVLETRAGRRVLDFYGGHAVALLGYGHPRLIAALDQQARSLFFQSNAVPLAVRERAARKLADFAPPGLDRVFFVNSGAEANENALRIALRASGRPRIVALEGGFHGRTAAAAAATWRSPWFGFPRAPVDVRFVPREDLAALENALSPGDVAAVLLEPVQGIAGAVDLSDGYLASARRLTREIGSLLIFDEVQCGMGRSGRPFVAQAAGVTPDILTTAKGLAGGFPAGAVLLTEELAASVRKGDLGSTFGGGPLAGALIEATLDAIENEGILANVRARAAQIRSSCLTGPVVEITGRGLLVGLRTRRPARSIQRELLDRDILVGTSSDPGVVRLLPPLIISASEVSTLAAALSELPA